MNKQVLVIDDSSKIHPLVKAILSEEPVDIHSAMDPHYGITLAASLKPDLILMDVDMPGMDGFSACKLLKADPQTAGCPIIFLTGHSEPKEKVHAFGLGAVDYVTKPFNPPELLARVRSSLRIHNAIRELSEQSLTDPLTGLGNRAMFERRLNAEVGLRVRSGNPLSIIMVDVDQFKHINDTWGHAVGDKALQKVSQIIIEACRVEDVACRMGGDEFAVIAPNSNAKDAENLAERIQKNLASSELSVDFRASGSAQAADIRVTASLGVAAANDPHDRTMLERADFAMYRAKQAGRNRVTVATPQTLSRVIAA